MIFTVVVVLTLATAVLLTCKPLRRRVKRTYRRRELSKLAHCFVDALDEGRYGLADMYAARWLNMALEEPDLPERLRLDAAQPGRTRHGKTHHGWRESWGRADS